MTFVKTSLHCSPNFAKILLATTTSSHLVTTIQQEA
jgi:hypothetical protein